MYYKVAPPGETNEVNIFLLSSAPISTSVLLPCNVAFREAGSEAKVTSFLPPRKSSETKSWTFLLQLICRLPGRFGEDQLFGLEDVAI